MNLPALSRRLFTYAELAERWQCSRDTVRTRLREGDVQCLRIGALVRVPEEAVEEFERTAALALPRRGRLAIPPPTGPSSGASGETAPKRDRASSQRERLTRA